MNNINLLAKADTAFQSHYYSDALNYYIKAENSNMNMSDEQIYRYSKLLFEMGSFSEALTQVNKINENAKQYFDVAILHYKILKSVGGTEKELTEFLENICNYSYDDEMMYELAKLYAKQGLCAKSKRICKKVLNVFRSGLWVEKTQKLYDSGCVINTEETSESNSVQKYSSLMEVESKTRETESTESVEIQSTNVDEEVPDFIEKAFDGMVGMKSVKQELVSFYNFAKLRKLREENLDFQDEDISYSFILYGNPGTGKTTVARIIGKVLFELGIRENDNFIEVDRGKIVAEHIGETAKLTMNAINSARGGTLFIDEAYALYKKDNSQDFGQEAIDTLLKDMEDNRNNYSVIMAGYKTPMEEMLKNSNPGFRSRFKFHINIPDYSDDELIEIAHKIADKKHYIINEDCEAAIRKSINRERIDETFGNARYIRDLIENATLNMATRLAKKSEISKDDLVLIQAEDVYTDENKGTSLNSLLAELDSLIGLSNVKNHIKSYIKTISVNKEMEKRHIENKNKAPSMHMAFKGSAGTGKTTVARLLGKILSELGVLKRGDVFVEVRPADVIGRHIGDTENNMKEKIQSAMGGILFIDEAYLFNGENNQDFGKKALDTLIAEMENHRDSFVVILAGYTKDIDELLSKNEGLPSRVPTENHIVFNDYSEDEMVEIFYLMVKSNGMLISDSLRKSVGELLKNKKKATKDFGNGRGVRNVFEAVLRAQKNRLSELMFNSVNQINDEEFLIIKEEDLNIA